MILSAQTISHLSLGVSPALIHPFHGRTVVNGKTFGISACGYDVRVDTFGPECGRMAQIAPSGFLLASIIEHLHMPDDLMGHVCDKSSWARKGLSVQNTVIEPGWRGYLTVELTNHGSNVLHLEQGDPIAQIIFHKLDKPTAMPYDGKYQDQKRGPQEAIEESS